jgi:urease beta subunit
MAAKIVGNTIPGKGDIETFPGRERIKMSVKNKGDRAIQVGSHYHFFEANRALDFDRAKAYGMKLDLPSGTAVRFEPGQTKEVHLVSFGGKQFVYGFNMITNGSSRTKYTKIKALEKAKLLQFKGV